MDCRETRLHLARFLDGEAAAEERARLESHLASCSACRACLEAMRASDRLVKSAEFERETSDDASFEALLTRVRENYDLDEAARLRQAEMSAHPAQRSLTPEEIASAPLESSVRKSTTSRDPMPAGIRQTIARWLAPSPRWRWAGVATATAAAAVITIVLVARNPQLPEQAFDQATPTRVETPPSTPLQEARTERPAAARTDAQTGQPAVVQQEPAATAETKPAKAAAPVQPQGAAQPGESGVAEGDAHQAGDGLVEGASQPAEGGVGAARETPPQQPPFQAQVESTQETAEKSRKVTIAPEAQPATQMHIDDFARTVEIPAAAEPKMIAPKQSSPPSSVFVEEESAEQVAARLRVYLGDGVATGKSDRDEQASTRSDRDERGDGLLNNLSLLKERKGSSASPSGSMATSIVEDNRDPALRERTSAPTDAADDLLALLLETEDQIAPAHAQPEESYDARDRVQEIRERMQRSEKGTAAGESESSDRVDSGKARPIPASAWKDVGDGWFALWQQAKETAKQNREGAAGEQSERNSRRPSEERRGPVRDPRLDDAFYLRQKALAAYTQALNTIPARAGRSADARITGAEEDGGPDANAPRRQILRRMEQLRGKEEAPPAASPSSRERRR